MSASEKIRMIFGFALLFVLGALAFMTGIGHVHQEASFGLDYILGALSAMSGGFVQWAFGHGRAPDSGPVAPPMVSPLTKAGQPSGN